MTPYPSEPIAACGCVHWCDVNIQHRMLTGHHENCKHSPNALTKALDIIKQLASGMEAWAADEDGIHPEAWDAYRRAMALQGIIIAEDGMSTTKLTTP